MTSDEASTKREVRVRPRSGMGNRAVDEDRTVELVGGRVRSLRAERGLTLQALARRTGLSSSMLSLVERGRTSPSIGTLVAISSALGVHMTDLFNSHPEVPPELVNRVVNQEVFVTGQGVKRRILRTDDDHGIELVFNEYEPGTGSAGEPVRHSGYEFGVVLDGRLTVEVDGRSYKLMEGDCIAYESGRPHRIINEGRGHVRAVWVNLDR